MKAPNYKLLAADFLSKAIATDQDLCLDFHPTDASHIVGQRVNLQEATPNTDIVAKFGLCIDHEAPDLAHIFKHARRAYFYIRKDKPFWYWVRKVHVHGGRVLFAEEGNFGYKIYATAYVSVDDFADFAVINVEDEQIRANIRANLDLGLNEIAPHQTQPDAEIALVFGGPSINEFAGQIYEQAKSGIPIVTANGAYNWCLEHKIVPAAQIVCDARAFNARFVAPVMPACKYLICSQCDPSLASSIPKDQVLLWHALGEIHNQTVKEYFSGREHNWFPVPGGHTVALRAIPLMMMLGYKKFHVYGLDSCITDTHHGYAQPEDDSKRVGVWEYGGRKFNCYPWMAHQCTDFMKIAKHAIGQACEMEIYGDGLIAHCIRTLGASEPTGEANGSDEMDVLQPGESEASEWGVRPQYSADADGAV